MTAGAGYLQLNYLRILQGVHVAYEEQFHEGVNIIRGQNGSGKSTIADFIFSSWGVSSTAGRMRPGTATKCRPKSRHHEGS